MPRRDAERLVHGQEAAVAVDQREADRKDVEQRLKVCRPATRRHSALSNSRKVPALPSPRGSSGMWTARSGMARSPSAVRRISPILSEPDQIGERAIAEAARRAAARGR